MGEIVKIMLLKLCNNISLFGGEGGIRTLGESPHAGFQDRYHQPLGHLSKEALGVLYQKNLC